MSLTEPTNFFRLIITTNQKEIAVEHSLIDTSYKKKNDGKERLCISQQALVGRQSQRRGSKTTLKRHIL